MRKILQHGYASLILVLLALPEYAFGQGLVPACSRGDDPSLNPCQFCDVVLLVNNVVAWLVGILGLIGAIIIVFAGVQLVVSGGNMSAKESAKKYITNIIIGYIIILAAWLLIDTGFKALVDDQKIGVWNQIECTSQPKAVKADQRVIDLGQVDFSPGRYSLEQDVNGNFGENSGAGPVASCEVASTGPCSESALQANGFGSLSGAAARIAGAESGCNPNAESRTDTTTDGRTYSVGTWQINLAAHSLSCNGRVLNCPSAFRDAGTRNKYNVKEKIVVDEALYNACVQAAKDPACNNSKAAELARNSGDMGDWACSAKKCGVNTSRNNKCPL